MTRLPLKLMLLSTLLLPSAASANDFIQWHSTNIQLLRGWDYELGSKQRTLTTLEHANQWAYGDFYGFIDYTFPDKGQSFYYAELSPRLSLSKISGQDFSYGPIKDVLIATMLEKPKDQKARFLYGMGINFDMPGFQFLTVNGYIRDNRELSGSTWQVTTAWKYPFKVGGMKFLLEGFADFAGSEGGTHPHQLIVPRFLLDAGDLAMETPDRFFVGIEWSYWHNKFGINGKTESAPQLQAKWVF